MPRPRKYATNADRQRAYRERKARREAEGRSVTFQTVSQRVMNADAAARARES